MTRTKQNRQRGAALILALLAITILTILGLALMFVSTTEVRLAAAEGSINKALYSADAGIQWTAGQLIGVGAFLSRPEFQNPSPALQYTEFGSPDHATGENPASPNITVRIARPLLIGRRSFPGASLNIERAQYL